MNRTRHTQLYGYPVVIRTAICVNEFSDLSYSYEITPYADSGLIGVYALNKTAAKVKKTAKKEFRFIIWDTLRKRS